MALLEYRTTEEQGRVFQNCSFHGLINWKPVELIELAEALAANPLFEADIELDLVECCFKTRKKINDTLFASIHGACNYILCVF